MVLHINDNSGPKTIQKQSLVLYKAGAPKNPANPRKKKHFCFPIKFSFSSTIFLINFLIIKKEFDAQWYVFYFFIFVFFI